ncbi:hypothetical protein MLD38_023573 [Melastoma candidum]|uniref:Uncharacterized protein n=1 Tax=Melastoma candidum TaxID=119954 RepID=A0ACB9NR71_9MYRT|nr:hypothetical protein MLD38_023573 [Melastoma candidum]
MVPELEKPRVTEIQVWIDCNGCVQKIKKALHGINVAENSRIYDVTMGIPQQKLRIIGWVDPERIVKAIRKTRKKATICSHAEQPNNQKPESGGPPREAAEPPPPQAPPTEPAPPPESPIDQPPSAPLPQKPMPQQEIPQPEASIDIVNEQQPQDMKPPPKDVGEVSTMHRHPQNYGYRYRYHNHEFGHDESWYGYPGSWRFQKEPLPPQPRPQPQQASARVTLSYNKYKPSPYVTEYEYVRSPPRFSHYRRMNGDDDFYRDDNRLRTSSGTNGNITLIFSDENLNACRIM